MSEDRPFRLPCGFIFRPPKPLNFEACDAPFIKWLADNQPLPVDDTLLTDRRK